jgi:chemotaxis protein histidine kinase CheA
MSDNDIVQDFLAESSENLDRLDRELVSLEKNPHDRDALASVFRTIHTIKGTCGFLGFEKLEKVTHVGESLLARLRDGQLSLSSEHATALLGMVDAVRQMLQEIQTTGEDGKAEYPELLETLTRLQQGENSSPSVKPSPDQVGGNEKPVAKGDDDLAAQQTAPSHSRDTLVESIRVGVHVLDKLMTLVGELVLARNRLLQIANSAEDTNLQAVSQRMNMIATELQEEVMKTRLQPIGNIWSQFPRTVRDVALGCGKEVNIEMEGKETELDKTIIEAIKDPLTHLVRNSVDHGIELPADRIKAGKNRAGRLILRAFHEGGQVNIEITDDGAGLDLERIRKKAVERAVVTAEQATRMTEREIFKLIFLPGFSTAEKVTKVSGRGVGMDVVKTNVETIGGSVDVQSAAGRGTTVRVKIPLTLAIIPALVVTSGGDRYAIPQVSLLELVRIEAEKVSQSIESVHGAPVYRLRGRLLPLVYLNRELNAGGVQGQDVGHTSTESGSKWEVLDFSQARVKHQHWLGRLREVLDNKASLTSQQAGSHTECALGKWLYSIGLKNYADLAEIHSVETTHADFHAQVAKVLGFKEQGHTAEAEQGLRQLGSLSSKIIALLTELERKVLYSHSVNIVVLQADDRQFGLVVDEINDTEEIVVKPLRKQLKTVKTFAGSSIMGDGKVALILDVLGLAQRASVVTETRDRALTEKVTEVAGTAAEKQTFLLFAGPDDSRMAIPLSTLARLEEFPVAQVEMAGSQWVTQYRGQILPLIRLNVVLEERRHKLRAPQAPPAAGSRPIQVLVLNHEGRSFGLVVERILDIVEDRAEVKSAATRPCVLHSVVIGTRVTELLDIPAILRNSEARPTRPDLAVKAAGAGN